MKNLCFSIIVFYLSLFKGTAQSSLSGTVSGNGHTIENVTVFISAKIATTTDKNGKYTLNLKPGYHSVKFTSVGFLEQTIDIEIGNEQKKELHIMLIEASQDLQNITLLGTRSIPRSAIGTPLPVDNFDQRTLQSTGQISFDKALQYRVPSFNTINSPVNDGTTLLDPYEIRNLGPSRTLILINGKRKNLSSLLYTQVAPGRGETGADLSAIPIEAIKNVEILRDGASAQYGSDAIAGVMNIILKDKYQYNSLTINSGITNKGDGASYGISFNSGANIGTKGFLNYTLAFNQQDDAIRSGKVDPLAEIAVFGGNPVTDDAIRRYLAVYPTAGNLGGTSAHTASKFNYNLGIPVGEKGLFYSNAAYVYKKANSQANFRPPYWRVDQGLLHTAVPGAPDYTGSTYGPPGSQLQNDFETDKANGLYQGYIGYLPYFGADITDFNFTAGVKNEVNGWKQDMSITVGGNQQQYIVNTTVNRSLLKASPTSFKPGGFSFFNVIGNLDFSKSLLDNFSIGFGSEVRKETYKIFAGDTASYSGEGSHSFPGFQQENAGSFSRYNIGAYFDANLNVSSSWMVNGTVRGEKYSDFGSAFVWKLSSRYKLAGDKLVVRSSVSTGFRAPTLHQTYAQARQGSLSGGVILLNGLYNNSSKEAFLLGIPKLKPEKSDNYTLGIGLKPTTRLSITLDYYTILISDRIVYSSAISSTNPATALYKILNASELVSIQFFINGIKTRTSGLDFVGNYKNIQLGKGKAQINMAANYTFTNKIIGHPKDPAAIAEAGSSILNREISSLLTKSRPKYKVIGGADYSISKWDINLNSTVFGPVQFQDLNNGGVVMNNIAQVFKTRAVTDVTVGFKFCPKISASITVENILNVLPKWDLELTGNSTDPNYNEAVATINSPAKKNLLRSFIGFNNRFDITGYYGSHFSRLGTIFHGTVTFRF